MVLQHPRKVRPPRALSVLFAVVALLTMPALASAHTLQPASNLQATAGGNGVALTWTASNDGHVTGYNVYRRTANGAFAGIAQTSGTSYTDSGATGGTYHVTAYDAQGAESAPTNDATAGSSAGTSSNPGPAASADVNVGDNYFSASTVEVKPGGTVTWHWTTGTTHTVSADAGQAETFDTSQSYGTYAHTFTQAGRYTYVCHRHSGMSGVVIVRDAPTTADSTAPPTPTAVSATPANASVSLAWGDVSAPDLAAYRVERQNLDGSWSVVGEPPTASFTDAGLTNGAAYTYRVSAYDVSGNQSAPSDPVTATPAAAATGPSERTVSIGGYAFGPEDIVVNKGDTVNWTWAGPDVNHTVTSAAGSAESFDSHPGVPDGSVSGAPPGGFQHTFTATGTFAYLCRVHPDMTGTVTVVESGADSTSVSGQRTAAGAPQAHAQPVVPAASNHVVKVAQYKFTPAALTIPQGDAVTWQWTGDDKDHSVSAKPGQADSWDSHAGLKIMQIKGAPPGGKFVHVFSTLGTFTYICRLHPNMVGSVTVVPRGKAAAAPLRVRAVRAAVRGGRVTVRFKLAEVARMRAELRRGSKRLRVYRFAARRGANARTLTLPRAARRGGRFRLALLATRTSGDRAAPVSVAVRVPRR